MVTHSAVILRMSQEQQPCQQALSHALILRLVMMKTSYQEQLKRQRCCCDPALHEKEQSDHVHDELRFYSGCLMIIVWLVL